MIVSGFSPSLRIYFISIEFSYSAYNMGRSLNTFFQGLFT